MQQTKIEIELFTHPTCSGCQEVLDALWKLSEQGIIELALCDLATPRGRRRAESLSVMSVPTVRVGDKFLELFRRSDLTAFMEELNSNSHHLEVS